MSCTAPAHLVAESARHYAEMVARRSAEARPAAGPQANAALLADIAVRIAAAPVAPERPR